MNIMFISILQNDMYGDGSFAALRYQLNWDKP